MANQGASRGVVPDKEDGIDNYVLVINCSECLSSQEFIEREYAKDSASTVV